MFRLNDILNDINDIYRFDFTMFLLKLDHGALLEIYDKLFKAFLGLSFAKPDSLKKFFTYFNKTFHTNFLYQFWIKGYFS